MHAVSIQFETIEKYLQFCDIIWSVEVNIELSEQLINKIRLDQILRTTEKQGKLRELR